MEKEPNKLSFLLDLFYVDQTDPNIEKEVSPEFNNQLGIRFNTEYKKDNLLTPKDIVEYGLDSDLIKIYFGNFYVKRVALIIESVLPFDYEVPIFHVTVRKAAFDYIYSKLRSRCIGSLYSKTAYKDLGLDIYVKSTSLFYDLYNY